jgi:hypothetical protein
VISFLNRERERKVLNIGQALLFEGEEGYNTREKKE